MRIKILIALMCFFVSFLSAACSYALQKEFNIDKIDFKTRSVSGQDSTISGLSAGKMRAMGKTQQWGVISVNYESAPSWADDVELRYYVLIEEGKSKKKRVMLSGSVVYIHVAKGKKHVSYMYVPPQVFQRYSKVLKIRAEVWYGGILQDSAQWPHKEKKVPWWTRIKPMYGSIVNRYYTPFEHESQTAEEFIKVQ